MGNKMYKKGYGRIYVADPTKVQAVKDCIKELDENEYEGYFHDEIVAPYDGLVDLVYLHKFEIDIDLLTQMCWRRGLFIWIISQGYDDNNNQFGQAYPRFPLSAAIQEENQ